MRSLNHIHNTRRVMLWSLPILAAVSLILSPVLKPLRQQDWRTHLEEYQTRSRGDSQWYRGGDVAVDSMGNIWIAGGPGLTGLHVFDGEKWTKHEGNFQDLAIAPNGQVWAVHALGDKVSGVDVFDGKQWKNYRGNDYGMILQAVLQAEVTSDGRLWFTTDPWGSNNKHGSNHAVEIINDEGEEYGVISDLQVRGTDGFIQSLDADNHGNIWAAVWTYEDVTTGLEAGLYMYDGESWQKVPDQGVDLRRVVRTSFDDQGNT
jgi:hypothetical protein